MIRPLGVPTEHTDKRLYEMRTSKHMFVNPPGHEDAHFIHKFGQSHRNDSPWPADHCRDRGAVRSREEFDAQRARHSMATEWAAKGPLK